MDHTRVVKQSWRNVVHYRALWIFGVILALTTMSWGGLLLFNGDDSTNEARVGLTVTVEPGETFSEAFERTVDEEWAEVKAAFDEADRDLEQFFAKELDANVRSDILTVIAIVVGVVLTIFVLAKIARYVAEVSLIRMVDEHEASEDASGVQYSVSKGFRLGWSRGAWRLFLIDLVINTPIAMVFLLSFVLALSPLLVWREGRLVAGVLGTLAAVGLVVLLAGLALLVIAGLSLLKPVFRRVCVLENQGAARSIRRGLSVVRQHFGDLGITWLITVVVSVAWPFVMIPAVFVLLGVAFLAGGASALLAGGLVALAFTGAAPWITAIASGIIIFLLVLVAPLAFLGGLREVFLSSVWTLSYRDLRPSESVASRKLTRMDPSGLEAASMA